MSQEEFKIYQEEIKKSPREGKRNSIKRYKKELGLLDMVASVAACQCEVWINKKK